MKRSPIKKKYHGMPEAKRELLKILPCHCELAFINCTRQMFLTPTHRHNRIAYKHNPDMLWSYNQVITACVKCHEKLDANKEYKEIVFKKLRGEDALKISE